jgi:hypothetical protein
MLLKGPPGPKGECEIIQVNNASNKVGEFFILLNIHFPTFNKQKKIHPYIINFINIYASNEQNF